MTLSDLIGIAALIIASIALCITCFELRRNHKVVVKIKKVSGHYTTSYENNKKTFSELNIIIENKGIVLFNPELFLSFNSLDIRGGLISFALNREKPSITSNDDFARGMIAEYYLKSYKLEEDEKALLKKLKDPAKQRPRLCLYSQGYLVKVFKYNKFIELLKTKWNSLSFKINLKFNKEIGKNLEGMPIIRSRKILPRFGVIISWAVMNFINYPNDAYIVNKKESECSTQKHDVE